MRERARRLGWVLGLLGGCASAAPATEPPSLEAETSTPESASDAQVDALLERELALHAERLEHSDPQERLRARIDLADAMLRRAARIEVERFELAEQRDSASGQLGRRDAQLAARHAQLLADAGVQFREVLASTVPSDPSVRAKAHYGLAEVLTLQGKTDEALAAREALVREHPGDPLVGATLLQLGDQAFGDMQFQRADALYLRAALFDDPSVRYYAVYKRGWIAFNADEGEQALSHWFRVAQEAGRHSSLRQLAEAATKDCVLAYAEVGRPERAKAFFERLDPQLAPSLLRRLAQRYRDQGRADAAVAVEGEPVRPKPSDTRL